MKKDTKDLVRNFFLTLLGIVWVFLFSCTSTIEKHISEHESEMDVEKQTALRNREIIPGMTSKEVKLILGEPKAQEQKENYLVWIYPEQTGVSMAEAYPSESSFAQGVAFVIPLNYSFQELRIFFLQDSVCKVEKIIIKDSQKKKEIK